MAIFNDDISINSLIGHGSFIKGDIKINGFTRIDGDLDGNLETHGNVIIGEKARINGNITARSITVGGVVKGNIIAPESVHLLSTSTVIGDIQTHRLRAEEDVVIHGHCISLSDETAYSNSVSEWQNQQAITSKSLKF
ncbi:MAG: polymer-forming cytoskeletal protein [Spirochaetales bacterium]|nr:polymer-forming cytoskeletal protein [Spirochaetales bacterium]